MLTSLHISNYALIAHLDISFNNGFSVITGETGAGKSIILGALGLLLGNRADTKAIREGEQKCIIEAEFDIEGYELQDFFRQNDLDYFPQCTIRREVSQNGKSRSFVNDTPVTLSVLKELTISLLDIHSQHENLQLGKDDFQRQIIDRLADNKNILDKYRLAYTDYIAAKQHLDMLLTKAAKEKADQDYIDFQLRQLQEAKLKEGEITELENQLQIFSHAEEIKTYLTQTCDLIDADNGALDLLRQTEQNITKTARYNNQAQELLTRLKSLIIELKDIADEVDTLQRNTEYDPQLQQQAEQRFDLLNTLLSKHHVETDSQLIEIQNQLEQRLSNINSYDQLIEQAEKEYQFSAQNVENIATLLSQSRFAVKNQAEKQIIETLLKLGIKHAQFEIQFDKLPNYTPHGIDKINFMFAANKNQQLQDVANVASGGEISRLMLAVKGTQINTAHMHTQLPTIIFDEIDTGVSGDIADSMGKLMQQMSQSRQIISITHLPQIAARGLTHYKVYKQDNETSTLTNIKLLNPNERITEIAAMLSGNHITPAAIENANELLNNSKN